MHLEYLGVMPLDVLLEISCWTCICWIKHAFHALQGWSCSLSIWWGLGGGEQCKNLGEREKKEEERKIRSEKKDHGMEDWQLSQNKNQIWRRKKRRKGKSSGLMLAWVKMDIFLCPAKPHRVASGCITNEKQNKLVRCCAGCLQLK